MLLRSKHDLLACFHMEFLLCLKREIVIIKDVFFFLSLKAFELFYFQKSFVVACSLYLHTSDDVTSV